MAASVFKTLLMMMVMTVAVAPVMATTVWSCVEISMQDNVTIDQVEGDWYIWDIYNDVINNSIEACLRMSLWKRHMENGQISLVTVAFRKELEGRDYSYDASYAKDNPGEIVVPGQMRAYRMHSLSPEGDVLILAVCRGYSSYMMTLGRSPLNLPQDVPRPSNTMFRRNVDACVTSTESTVTRHADGNATTPTY